MFHEMFFLIKNILKWPLRAGILMAMGYGRCTAASEAGLSLNPDPGAPHASSIGIRINH